jgi:hypothetical protein
MNSRARVVPHSLLTLVLAGCATVQHRDAAPTVTVDKSTYAPGESIVVTFSNGPGNRDDWIAIYADGKTTEGGDNDPHLKCWYYTNGTHDTGEAGASAGSVVLDGGSENSENAEADWPLAEGDYDVYFICCEGYDVLAGPAHLTIASAARD